MASYQPPPTYADVILVDPENKKPAKFNPIWLNWFLGLTQKLTPGGAGSGTVTDVSVITANGLAGSVANSATTPAITLSTTITGLLKGNGTAISAAVSGTDYAPPTSGTSILYGNGSGGFYNVTIGTGVSFAAGTLSATGSGGTVTSVTGTAPVVSSGGTTPVISMAAATTSVNGYLTSTDWTTFNGKQAALVSGTNIKTVNGTTLLGSGDLGTITYAYGGTGQTTVTTGDLLYGSASNVWSKLGIGTTGQILRVVSGAPAWGTDYTGTVTSVAALTLGTTGTDLSSTVANGTTTPVITLNVPTASASNRGALSAADWTTFNSKGSGTVTSVTGSAPVVSSGGTTPAISMAAATTSVSGYLTSTDWTTFNNKGSGTVTSVSGTAGRVSSTGGTTPVIDLVSGIASAGTTGSASLIPVVTIDTYGRVTSITTAANPQGTVTSVGWTGGIVSVATATTTPAFTVAGTSGGVPYFSSASTWATSAALAASAIVIGGGAGAAPSTTTTGTGVVTALGVNTGTAGAFVVNGGALGTPSSGTVTNLTGTASININGTVGATTANTGAFTTLTLTNDTPAQFLQYGLVSASYQQYNTFYAFRGTRASPTQVLSGDVMALNGVYAYDNTATLRVQGFTGWKATASITGVNQSAWSVMNNAGTDIIAVSSTGLAVTGAITATSINFGSTSLANYEEGTWTPTVAGSGTAGTYQLSANASATYQRVGNLVTIVARILMASVVTGGGTGNVRISGLPFNMSASKYGSAFTCSVSDIVFTGTFVSGERVTSAATSTLYFSGVSALGTQTQIPISSFIANTVLSFQFHYWI